VAGQLGDRVKHYFTINEFRSFVQGGYQGIDAQVGGGKTVHLGAAPGVRLSNGELNQVRHHAVLGHGLAVQAIRANGPAGTKVGFAENMLTAVPVIETPEYIKAAETVTRELNADFTTVILEGRYTDDYLTRNGADAPKFTDGELTTIAAPLDFVGINSYRPNTYVTPSEEPPGWRSIPINASHPKMQSEWHVFDPQCIYWAPHHVQSLWGANSICITENGCTASDVVADDGQVYDSDRVMLLRAYLTQLQRATAAAFRCTATSSGARRTTRMDLWLRQPVRAGVRGLQHAKAHAQAQRRMVPRGGAAQRRSLRQRAEPSGSPATGPRRHRAPPRTREDANDRRRRRDHAVDYRDQLAVDSEMRAAARAHARWHASPHRPPGDIATQSHVICAPRQVIAERPPAVQNGGSAHSHLARTGHGAWSDFDPRGYGIADAGAGLQRRRHARDAESWCPESHVMGGLRARCPVRCEPIVHAVAHIYVLAYSLLPCRQSSPSSR
jgi:glycosyl hydrolase family 1